MDRFFRGTPWALPTLVVLLVAVTLVAGRLARRLGVPTWISWFYLASAAGYVSVTMTPGDSAGFVEGDYVSFSWSVSMPSLSYLTGLNGTSLNVWLTIPLGMFAVLLAVPARKFWPILLAVAAPVVAESFQGFLPAMGRNGFSGTDVATNWTGVVVGAVIGGALAALLGTTNALRRQDASPVDQGPRR